MSIKMLQERMYDEEARHMDLQVVLFHVLDSSLSPITILPLGNVLAADSNKCNRRGTRSGAERICKVFSKEAEAFLATNAKAFFGFLVQGNHNLESVLTYYSSINDRRFFRDVEIQS